MLENTNLYVGKATLNIWFKYKLTEEGLVRIPHLPDNRRGLDMSLYFDLEDQKLCVIEVENIFLPGIDTNRFLFLGSLNY
jgi:hypothetical protein